VLVAGVMALVTGLCGCFTTMGYGLGSAADNARARFEFQGDDTARGLVPAERVRLRCRDGSEKEGTFVAIQKPAAASEPPLLLLRQSPAAPPAAVPLGDISAVGEWRRPASGRIVGVVAGLAVDAFLAVLFVRSSVQVGSVGPFN